MRKNPAWNMEIRGRHTAVSQPRDRDTVVVRIIWVFFHCLIQEQTGQRGQSFNFYNIDFRFPLNSSAGNGVIERKTTSAKQIRSAC